MKKKQSVQERKLRRAISKIIKEQGLQGGSYADSGGYVGGGMMVDPASMYGAGYGQFMGAGGQMHLPGDIKSQHFKDVWQSIKDVFSTAAGVGKEVMQKVFSLVKMTVAGSISVIFPVLEADYERIISDQNQKIEKIRSEYKDVDDRVKKSLSDSDLGMLAFYMDPVSVTGGFLLKKAPGVVGGVLDTLTGGRFSSRHKFGSTLKKTKKDESTIKRKNILVEKSENDDSSLKKAIEDKKIIRSTLENSNQVQSLQDAGMEIHKEFLNSFYSDAKDKLTAASSIDGLKQVSKGKFAGLDTSKLSDKEKEAFEKLSKEDKEKMEKEILDSVKSSMKEEYIKKINSRISSLMSYGIKEDSKVVKDHMILIDKIKSL